MNPNDRQPITQPMEKLYTDPNLLLILSVTLMAVLGVSSITPAFPWIGAALGIPPGAISLVVIAFTIPGVFLAPFLGVLADRFGRKTILIPSLFLFGVAGGACAFARDFTTLLIFRFFQGVGAAALGVLNVTIIGDLYSAKSRGDAMGYNASITSIGTAVYPAIGGALAAFFGWFFPFFLPLTAIPIGILVLFGLRNPEPEEKTSFKEYLHQAKQVLYNRQVAGLFVASTMVFVMLYGTIITYLPYQLRNLFGVDPFISGLVISSLSVAAAIIATMVGWLIERFSERRLMLIAFPLYALSLILIPVMPFIWAGAIYPIFPFIPIIWSVVIPCTLFGIAQALNMPSIQTLLVGLSPPENRAALMSINGLVLRLGQTLGPLIMGIVVIFYGLLGVFWVGAALGILVVPVLFLTLQSKSKKVPTV